MENLSLFNFEPAKQTSRSKFFKEIEPYLPMAEWLSLLTPLYSHGFRKEGRPRKPLEVMLRTYLVQNFFSLSDEATEDALYDSFSVRAFVGITTNDSDIPDHTTICRFRNFLVAHHVQEQFFEEVLRQLEKRGLLLSKGTIVDSTIIESSTSKRNKAKRCDPASAWTKKAGNFRHGFKAHIGVNDNTGYVTRVHTTAANCADVTEGMACVRTEDTRVFGDSGYLGMANHGGRDNLRYHLMARPSSIKKMKIEDQPKAFHQQQVTASIRTKVEHVFATTKKLFGWRKTRYRGLEKNQAKNFMLFSLANIWKLSRPKAVV